MASSETADLVVVGARAAGMTAALVAALEGLKVILLEASDQVGGTTSTSAGTLWVPGNTHGAQAGTPDALVDARRYLHAAIGDDDRHASLRDVYLASGVEAIDFLEARSSVRFRSSGPHPDYLDLPGAALAGRAISPVEFDGRLLGSSFARVRAPMPRFMVLGGMMVGKADIDALLHPLVNLRRTANFVGRYLRDRLAGHARGTRLVMGNALVARLLHSLLAAGVEIRYGERLTALLRDGTRVIGAVTMNGDQSRRWLGTRGVVLACGGIGHHAALRATLGATPYPSWPLAAESVCGEGIQAAREAGAAFARSEPDFLWQPVSRVPEGASGVTLYPHLFLDRAKPGLLAIDAGVAASSTKARRTTISSRACARPVAKAKGRLRTWFATPPSSNATAWVPSTPAPPAWRRGRPMATWSWPTRSTRWRGACRSMRRPCMPASSR